MPPPRAEAPSLPTASSARFGETPTRLFEAPIGCSHSGYSLPPTNLVMQSLLTESFVVRDPKVFLVNIKPTEGRNYTKLPVRHVNTEFCFTDNSNTRGLWSSTCLRRLAPKWCRTHGPVAGVGSVRRSHDDGAGLRRRPVSVSTPPAPSASSCPVRQQCLDDAYANETAGRIFGVRGGRTPKERARARRRLS